MIDPVAGKFVCQLKLETYDESLDSSLIQVYLESAD